MSTLAEPDVDLGVSEQVVPAVPWNVILHNDDVNDFGYVIKTLQIILQKPKETCEKYAMTAHETGKAVVFDGPKDECENIATELQAAALWATVEKAGDL